MNTVIDELKRKVDYSKMNYSPKAGLEPLYYETNRSISDTHAALAQLNNYVNYGPSPQNVNTRKIETSINTIIR